MNRYLVFGGRIYYPSKAWGDFKASHPTIEEAIQFTKEKLKVITPEPKIVVLYRQQLKVVNSPDSPSYYESKSEIPLW